MTNIMWLMLTVVFAIFEAVTVQLVSIWFAGGAFFAWLAGIVGLGVSAQIAVFIITSALLLLITRPLVKKLLKKRDTATNLDRIIGKTIIVSEKVDNFAPSGKAVINGVSWSLRSDDGYVIEAGECVTVERIEGVHLVVKR